MKKIWMSAVCASALLACDGVTIGDVLEFTADDNNDFHNPLNWEDSGGNTGAPTDDDRIWIPENLVCNVVADGGTVEFTIDTMKIDEDGVLNIANGVTLILENDDDNVDFGFGPVLPDHSIVNGEVNVGSGAGGGTLHVQALWPGATYNEHIFGGDGKVDGVGDRSVIEIGEDQIFVNQLGGAGDDNGIFNWFKFRANDGAATFNNEGRVVADIGDISFESTLDLEDAVGAIWGVDDCEHEMKFAQSATLAGDFVMFSDDDGTGSDGGGEFWLSVANITIDTSGTLVVEQSCPFQQWTLASGCTFEYETFDCSLAPSSCATCTNPCDTCTGPYQVTSSETIGSCGDGS